jgi:hypothetical protein
MFAYACARPLAAGAQQPDPHAAQPERPSVATHAYSVAPGWIEVEFGAERDSVDRHFEGAAAPVAIKLGLASHLQLTVLTGVTHDAGATGVDPSDLGVSLKWRMADAVPGLGAIAVQPGLVVSMPGHGVDREIGANVILIASQSIHSVSLDLNAGVTRWTGDGTRVPRTESMWAISTGGSFGGPVGWDVELSGLPRTSGPAGQLSSAAFLVGPVFTVRPSLVFDVGLMAPVTGPQPRVLYAGGVWNAGRVWTPRK